MTTHVTESESGSLMEEKDKLESPARITPKLRKDSCGKENLGHTAFNISVAVEPGLIKKHPPLRLRKLGEDNQIHVNQEMINHKQALAEKRRSQVWKE